MADDAASAEPPAEAPLDPFAAARARALAAGAAAAGSKPNTPPEGGSEDGAVHVWDLVEAKQRLRLPAHRAAAVGLAYHPTKHELLTASHDGACHLWALPGG